MPFAATGGLGDVMGSLPAAVAEAGNGELDVRVVMPLYSQVSAQFREQMTTEATTVTALLHDVVEDTDYTLADLAEMDFGDEIIAALKLLTHADGVDYMDYVRAIKTNPIAKAVKLADLRHNSDPTRVDTPDERMLTRWEKYRQAIALLEE